MPGDVLTVLLVIGASFAILFAYYLSKAIRGSQLKRLLRNAVSQFATFPQIRGEVIGIHANTYTVSFHDAGGQLRTAELVREPDQPAEAGMPVQLRTAAQQFQEYLNPVNMQSNNRQPLFIPQEQTDQTGLIMTERNWNAVLSSLTERQKVLGRANTKNALIASGAGMIDFLIALGLTISLLK